MSGLPHPSVPAATAGLETSGAAKDLMRLGRMREAIDLFEEALVQSPNDRSTLYLCGLAHSLDGSLGDAERYLTKVTTLEPKHIEANFNLAIVLMRLRRFEDAFYSALRVVTSVPNCVVMLEWFCDFASAIHWYEAAISHRQRLIALQPDVIRHTVALSCDLLAFNRGAEAAALLAEILDDLQTNPKLAAKAILPLWAMGELLIIENALRDALTETPNCPSLLYNLGTTLLRRGALTDAVEYFDAAVTESADCVEAWHNRGVALELLGDLRGAIYSYEQALLLSPENNRARQRHDNLLPARFATIIVDRLSAGRSYYDVLARLRETLRLDRRLFYQTISFFKRAGLHALLRTLLEDMIADQDLPLDVTGAALADNIMAQYSNVTQLEYEVECYGHLDFRDSCGVELPLLMYLSTPKDVLLAEALALYDSVLAIQGIPDLEVVRSACLAALQAGDLGRVEQFVERYRSSHGEVPLVLRNILGFVHHAREQGNAARFLLGADRGEHRWIPCRYADAGAAAEDSREPAALDDSPCHPIEIMSRVVRDGSIVTHHSSISLPPSRFHRFRNAKLVNLHGTLISSNGEIIRQTINCDPGLYYGGWPNIDLSIGDKALVSCSGTMPRIDAPVVLAAYSRDQANYAHWMLDILPRILLGASERELDDRVILLTGALTSWQRETLELLGVNLDRIVCVTHSTPVELADVVLPVTSEGLFFFPDAFNLLRRRFVATGLMSSQPPTRRLFVVRKAGFRHLLNNGDVESYFLGLGFEKVSPGELSVADQVRIFSEAKEVVAVGGAAVANMAFMQPGASVLVLGPSSNYGNYFAYLASLLNIQYGGVLGAPVPDLKNQYVGWDFRVELKDLQIVGDLLHVER